MGRWDTEGDITVIAPLDPTEIPNGASDVKRGAIMFFIWSLLLFVAGVMVGYYLL